MPIAPGVSKLELEVEDRTWQSVSCWKDKTAGKAIGCFPVYAPVEIFHAGGVLPVGLFGGGTSVEITHADSRFQSFVCSIAKTTLEMGFVGRLELFDGLVFSSICDVARNLSSVFKRNFPDRYVEYMHLPQNPPGAAALDYFRNELDRIKGNTEKALGVRIEEDALAQSIRLYNRVRAALRNLYVLRAAKPENLPSRELFVMTRAATFLPPEESYSMLKSFQEEVEKRKGKKKDRIRVIIEGSFCEQPSAELVGTIEEAGCYIVDDDFAAGWRFFEEDVSLDRPPLEALAAAVLERSRHTSVKHDSSRPRTERLVEKVKRLGADAVLVAPAKFCEPALFDYVLFRDVFEREGIPHLFLEFEEKMWTFERLRNEVETFVESLLFE